MQIQDVRRKKYLGTEFSKLTGHEGSLDLSPKEFVWNQTTPVIDDY